MLLRAGGVGAGAGLVLPGVAAAAPVRSGYAPVNGLEMYYEIHGRSTGTPLLLVQGAFMSTGQWGPFLPAFLSQGPVSPEDFAGSQIETVYLEIAPRPEDFPVLVAKINDLDARDFDWTDDLGDITTPTLLVISDADIVTIEHAAEMLRLLGGGGWGDVLGIPNARLAVPPGTSHFLPFGVGMLDRHQWLVPVITHFQDNPDPVPPPDF